MPTRRSLRTILVLFAIVPLVALGCSTKPPRVWVPPPVDLADFGALGMVEFDAPAGDGLGALTSREFMSAIQRAQPGTSVLELGDEKRLLAAIAHPELDPEALRAIAEKYHLDALIVGVLEPALVQPKLAFDSGAPWMSASAKLESSLAVRILETRSGATLWSASTHARADVARVDLSTSGVSSMGASQPDEARLTLVRRLVTGATQDFRPYWD